MLANSTKIQYTVNRARMVENKALKQVMQQTTCLTKDAKILNWKYQTAFSKTILRNMLEAPTP